MSLAGCNTAGPPEAPGALPKTRPGVQPRLHASTFAAHGELLERRGDFVRAAEQYRKAIELAPDLVSAHNRLGVTLNRLGRHTEATTEFREALVRSPRDAQLFNNLGFSLYLEQKYDEAGPAFARALELQPTFRRARMNHGLVLARQGEWDRALAEFRQAGSAADAHYNIAVIQAESGQYAAAARSLEEALRCDPELDAAREQLRQIARLAADQETARTAAAQTAVPEIVPTADAEEPAASVTSEDQTRLNQALARLRARLAEARETAEEPATVAIIDGLDGRLDEIRAQLAAGLATGAASSRAGLDEIEAYLRRSESSP